MNGIRKSLLVLVLLCVSLFSASALTGEEIKQIIFESMQNLFPPTCEMRYRMTNRKPGKKEVTYEFHVWVKDQTNVLLEITYPAIVRGRKILNTGDGIWMYLPRSSQTLRLAFKQDLMGGEATNTDVLRLDLIKDYDFSLINEEVRDGVECYVFELKAKDRRIAYDKVIYWVSKKQHLPVKREMYTLSGQLLKTMRYYDVKKINGKSVPSRLQIENALDPAFQTEIYWFDIIPKNSIPLRYFTLEYLKSGR